MLKVLAVLYCLYRGEIHQRLRYFINSCVVTPFLLFHLKDFNRDAVDYVPTHSEMLQSFIYDNVLEHINQLSINLFFFVVINQTGLSIEQLVTIPINVAMIFYKLYQIFQSYRKSKKEVKEHLSVNVSNPLQQTVEIINPLEKSRGILNPLEKSIEIINPSKKSIEIMNPSKKSRGVLNLIEKSREVLNPSKKSREVLNPLNKVVILFFSLSHYLTYFCFLITI